MVLNVYTDHVLSVVCFTVRQNVVERVPRRSLAIICLMEKQNGIVRVSMNLQCLQTDMYFQLSVSRYEDQSVNKLKKERI